MASKGITSEGGQVELKLDNITKPIQLSATSGDLKGSKWYVVAGSGFDDEPSASAEGHRVLNALILAGAKGLGVDTGYNQTTSGFGSVIKQEFRERFGVELRDNVFGLMVYEDTMESVFLEMNAQGSVSQTVEVWTALLNDALDLAPTMTERQKVTAQLINDSHFLPSPEVKFVVRISAVETLCDQKELSSSARELVDELIRTLDGLPAQEEERLTLRRTLEWAKKQSIRNAYMTKITALLGSSIARRFDALYVKRSKYVHDGLGRGSLTAEAEEAGKIASDLLFADLGELPHKH